MLFPAKSFAAVVEVNNVTDLQNAVTAASDGDIIKLSDSFVFGSVSLTMPSVGITIDGKDQVWNVGTIKISGNQGGTLTIKNLKVDGSTTAGRLLTNNASNGTLVLEKMEFYNSTGGAVNINTSGTSTTEISNTKIYDNTANAVYINTSGTSTTYISYTKIYNNTAVNTAPAIWAEGSSTIFINNSTIEDNTGTGAGYECGAISGKFYNGNLKIENTVFRNNVNKCGNSGVTGGGGGAMAMHYFKGNLTIDECLFEANKTNGTETSAAATYDGGAIYIFDGGNGNVKAYLTIKSTTFDSNLAYDDGGAMMLQATSGGLTTVIDNCTFYNNKAYGLSGGQYSGGAIQLFKNGGWTGMSTKIRNSTFVKNQAGCEQSTKDQNGGAIGRSGSSTFAAVTNNGVLFIGNKVYDANGQLNTASVYKDVSGNYTTQEGTTNVINVDKGATPAYTAEDILGKNYYLCENRSGVKAGVNDEIIKTIPIKPEGIADNTYSSSTALPGEDQRGFKNHKDHGAIEMSWVKYDANGGEFGLTPQTEYEGKVYYEVDNANKVTSYFTIGTINGDTMVLDGKTGLNATHATKEFLGWAKTNNATAPDPLYLKGTNLTYLEKNDTLYAVWGDAGKVIYHSNFDTDVTSEVTPPGGNVTIATYPATGLPSRPNHIFTKWTTNHGGTGTTYLPGSTLTVTTPTDLYAQWESNDVLKLQWSVSKTTNALSDYNDVVNNSTTSVMVGTPVYVQIRPVSVGLEHIEYDTWSIEYTATPANYHYPMSPIAKTVRYNFNKGDAHTLVGTYNYNVSKLTLYKAGNEVVSYFYQNGSCTHKISIETPPVKPVPDLQWSVSTVSHQQAHFKDVNDQATTTVNYGTPVFVQINPIGCESINYERWDIEYSVTPAECYCGMNPTIKTECYCFNSQEAHTEVGTYIYTVTKLTLYDLYGNQVVETYDYKYSPYKHTIIIQDEEPSTDIALQWSVSTSSNQLKDFLDVKNLTTTTVNKGTPVYVQIRPESLDYITYDRWEIEYTATPADYHYPLDKAVAKSERYTFNKGEALTLVGTYVYTVNKLTLYNGQSVVKEQNYTEPAYIHTVVIREGGLIGLGDIAPYCGSDTEFRIPVQQFSPGNVLEYSIRFSEEALNAGFANTDYKDVTVNYLTVPVSNKIAKGIYSGSVYVRMKSDPGQVEVYTFEIEVLQTTTITKQPQSVQICDNDNFVLKVEAVGINLSYQWFFNEEAIPGATSDSYEAPLTSAREGIYHVDVYGDCGQQTSDKVTVAQNGLRIQIKWNDFMYITNLDNEYVRFQWYKDGQMIEKHGNSIYYSVPEGLLGTYWIRAFRADDTYADSCPITFETLTQFPTTRVFPTMVSKSTPITVQTGTPGDAPESATVEVYNLNGQIVNRMEMKTWEATIPTDMASGNYIVKVTTASGKTTTHKIIIK